MVVGANVWRNRHAPIPLPATAAELLEAEQHPNQLQRIVRLWQVRWTGSA